MEFSWNLLTKSGNYLENIFHKLSTTCSEEYLKQRKRYPLRALRYTNKVDPVKVLNKIGDIDRPKTVMLKIVKPSLYWISMVLPPILLADLSTHVYITAAISKCMTIHLICSHRPRNEEFMFWLLAISISLMLIIPNHFRSQVWT